jgi:hypothetical protein
MQGCAIDLSGSQYGPFVTSVLDGDEGSALGSSRFIFVEETLVSTR